MLPPDVLILSPGDASNGIAAENLGKTGDLRGEDAGLVLEWLEGDACGSGDVEEPLMTALATATAAVAVMTLGNEEDEVEEGIGIGVMTGIFNLVGDVIEVLFGNGKWVGVSLGSRRGNKSFLAGLSWSDEELDPDDIPESGEVGLS